MNVLKSYTGVFFVGLGYLFLGFQVGCTSDELKNSAGEPPQWTVVELDPLEDLSLGLEEDVGSGMSASAPLSIEHARIEVGFFIEDSRDGVMDLSSWRKLLDEKQRASLDEMTVRLMVGGSGKIYYLDSDGYNKVIAISSGELVTEPFWAEVWDPDGVSKIRVNVDRDLDSKEVIKLMRQLAMVPVEDYQAEK